MEGTPQSSAPGKAAAEPLKELTERLGPKLEEAEARLRDANERAKDFIKKNPGSCLLGAALLGFLVGRWAASDD
jgi:hypothetical protein